MINHYPWQGYLNTWREDLIKRYQYENDPEQAVRNAVDSLKRKAMEALGLFALGLFIVALSFFLLVAEGIISRSSQF